MHGSRTHHTIRLFDYVPYISPDFSSRVLPDMHVEKYTLSSKCKLREYLRYIGKTVLLAVLTVQSIPDLVTLRKGPGGPLTSRPSIAARGAIKAHSHFVQGSDQLLRDRPALIASDRQVPLANMGEVAFRTGCCNNGGSRNS